MQRTPRWRLGFMPGLIGAGSLIRDVKRLPIHMPYALIVLVASIALTVVYVFVTDASYWSKALVTALLLVSFTWRYGFYLRAGLGVFLALYFTYLKARWEHD
jgi:hypothetical protein